MRQVGRTLTGTDGLLSDHRVLICDRDRKWSRDVRQLLGDAGVHVVQTPFQAPNANAYAERFVRSINTSASIASYRSASATFDGPSRNSSITTIASGITKDSRIGLSMGARRGRRAGGIRRRPRLGGLLNYYERAA